MSEGNEEKFRPEDFLAGIMKSTTEIFESLDKTWLEIFEMGDKNEEFSESEVKARLQESWEGAMKSWKAFSSTMSEPEEAKDFLNGLTILPEILMRMSQARWDGAFFINQQWMERLSRIGESAGAYKFDSMDESAFSAFMDIYEKEFRQYFNIPQLGLGRFYQERFNKALDQFNIFQATVGEFMYLCHLPVDKSFKVMQEKLSEMAEKGDLPDNPKDYYRLWIKILEGHYMTLFKSPEYTKVLSKTLNAMETFMKARQEIIQDSLQGLPIPTNKEMDELYKEIYNLKKRVRDLEKGARKK